MDIIREVHCRVRIGAGPKWADKTVTVFLADYPDEASESEIYDAVVYDAKVQLRNAGFIRLNIIEVAKP